MSSGNNWGLGVPWRAGSIQETTGDQRYLTLEGWMSSQLKDHAAEENWAADSQR